MYQFKNIVIAAIALTFAACQSSEPVNPSTVQTMENAVQTAVATQQPKLDTLKEILSQVTKTQNFEKGAPSEQTSIAITEPTEEEKIIPSIITRMDALQKLHAEAVAKYNALLADYKSGKLKQADAEQQMTALQAEIDQLERGIEKTVVFTKDLVKNLPAPKNLDTETLNKVQGAEMKAKQAGQ